MRSDFEAQKKLEALELKLCALELGFYDLGRHWAALGSLKAYLYFKLDFEKPRQKALYA